MDLIADDFEEAAHDRPPGLRIHRLRQIHGPLYVGEQDGHLLALALQRPRRRDHSLCQVVGDTRASGGIRLAQTPATAVAEPLAGRILLAAGGTCRCCEQGLATLATEARGVRVAVSAGGAVHAGPPIIGQLQGAVKRATAGALGGTCWTSPRQGRSSGAAGLSRLAPRPPPSPGRSPSRPAL